MNTAMNQAIGRSLPDLVEQIYATIERPTGWRDVLAELVSTFDARSGRLLVLDSAARKVHNSYKLNIDDSFHENYVNHFVNLCPWRPELRQKPVGQMYSTFLDFSCPQPDFLRSEFYNDWAKPQDIAHGLLGTVYQDSRINIQLLLQRTHRHGHFTAEEKAATTRLLPHIRRALRLRAMLEDSLLLLETRRLSLPDNTGWLMLEHSGHVVEMNGQAEHVIAACPSLQLESGALSSHKPVVQARLLERLLIASNSSSCADSGPLKLAMQDGGQLDIEFIPADRLTSTLAFGTHGRVLVTFNVTPSQQSASHVSASQFGLTRSESAVAEAIAAGSGPAEIAAARGVSVETIRSQLKSIYSKTGVHSQRALVSLLLNIA